MFFRSESVLSTSSSTKKSLKKKRPDSQSGKAVKNRKESDAARTIQRNWRRHRDDKRKIEVVDSVPCLMAQQI